MRRVRKKSGVFGGPKTPLEEEGREGVEPSRDGFAIRCLSHLATAPGTEQQQNTRGNLRAVGGLSGLCVLLVS